MKNNNITSGHGDMEPHYKAILTAIKEGDIGELAVLLGFAHYAIKEINIRFKALGVPDDEK